MSRAATLARIRLLEQARAAIQQTHVVGGIDVRNPARLTDGELDQVIKSLHDEFTAHYGHRVPDGIDPDRALHSAARPLAQLTLEQLDEDLLTLWADGASAIGGAIPGDCPT